MVMQEILRDLIDPANGFAHLSYIFLISAMLMSSLRLLRVLALASGLAAMAHFIFRTQDNASLVWETMFVLANGVQLAILQYRSRRSSLQSEERELLHAILQIEDQADQRRVLGLLRWRDAAVGEILMQQGELHPPLIYISAGAATVEVDGRLVGACGAGDFLGEISHVAKECASATVKVSNTMRIAEFDRQGLAAIPLTDPEIAKAIDSAVNRSLAAKLVRMNDAAKAGAGHARALQIGG